MQGTSDPNLQLLDAASLCRHLVDPQSVAALLADHRHELFPDELFGDLFPSGRGRPSVPADVIASVMVLQALEGLSDRDAASQLRTNIAWKVACGLAIDDPGFHATVLTLWRNRLRTSARPQRIFDAVRAVVAETGVLAKRQRRALDSTVLDDAVTRQDTLMQLTAQIRVVRRLIPAARALQLSAHDYEQGGAKPACAWNDPADINRVVTELVTDAHTVLDAVRDLDLSDSQAEAVGLLALVSGQDVEPGDSEGTWRIAQRTAPDRIVSVHDPESRHVHKTDHNYRDGFKAHVAVEPETGLITACDLSAGNVGDAQVAPGLLADESPGLEVLADSAYGSGQHRAQLLAAQHLAVIKPIPLRATVPGGFSIDDFAIDGASRSVTCPAGHTVPMTHSRSAKFGSRCHECSLRSRCTTARDGRDLKVHRHHELLAAARRQAETETFQRTYTRWRPMVERSLAWLVRKGNRRVAYRGIDRNRIWLSHRVAAVDLRRLLNLGLSRTPDGWAVA
ncbi:MAG TPA: IS1182 family transposase [Candidatus Saccharimonadales bacterium]|nr:IS1182 family transposase [Candidatus Saccharimonadales bacterium]